MLKQSGKILCLLTAFVALPSFAAVSGPANVQCSWDQAPVVVTLSVPATTDCHVWQGYVYQGTPYQFGLLCNVPVTLVIGNLTYSTATQIMIGYNNDSQSLQEYNTKGFSIFSMIPMSLSDATGFNVSLTMTSSGDGKSLVPTTLTVPNVTAPCAIDWPPPVQPPVVIHPPIPNP